MLDEILILTLVVLGMNVLRLTRGTDGAGRGYVLVVSLILGLVVAAMVRDSDFLAFVGVALTMLIVIGPWLLEHFARWAFGQGALAWAVRLAGWRAVLMLGSGLSRHQGILQGLALLERDGVDRALAHFRGLAEAAEDTSELALIHEQIVSMLLYGHRWDEGIAHYEARFPPRYAALRPALALGLMRAYGESGRLEQAAGLLRALEDGPVGADPRSSSLLSQARLTFLAYAGVVGTVEQALQEDRRILLGLSPATGALLEGIAWSRAGHLDRAQRRLQQVERLASRREARVVDASRRVIEHLRGAAGAREVQLAPELGHYAEIVARRLETFLRVTPTMRRPGGLVVTWICIGVFVGLYSTRLLWDGGTMTILRLGALTPDALLQAGEGWRVLSGVWAQGDAVAVVLNAYALWLAGPVVERIYGSGRMLLAGLGGGVLGLLAASVASAGVGSADAVYGGAHLLTTAIVAAAIWTLLPVRSPAFPPRARRALLVPLSFVFIAEALCIVPGVVALDVPAVGLCVAALVGLGVAWMPPKLGRVLGWLGLSCGLLVGLATLWAWRTDPTHAYMAGASRRIPLAGETVSLARPFAAVEERVAVSGLSLPIQPGAVDALAIRTGNQVQIIAADLEAKPETVLFSVDPALRHELTLSASSSLSEAFAAPFAAEGADLSAWRLVTLRRNGEVVGSVVEPTYEGPGRRIALLTAPATALDPAPEVYARVLAGLGPGGP